MKLLSRQVPPENRLRFPRTKPLSAMMTLQSAPKAVAQPSQARVRLAITEPEAAKIGLRGRWQAAQQCRQRRAARKLNAEAALSESVSRLLERAQTEQWSQRLLASKIGIPETTFRRIRDQKVNPLVWLPKLQPALARLTPSTLCKPTPQP